MIGQKRRPGEIAWQARNLTSSIKPGKKQLRDSSDSRVIVELDDGIADRNKREIPCFLYWPVCLYR